MASEENEIQNEQVDLAALAQQGEEIQDDQGGQENNLPEFTESEQEAYPQGWRPKEEFKGDVSKWKEAEQYLSDGKWINQIKELNQKVDNHQRQFDERLSNANKLNNARREDEIKALKVEQRNAVNLADTAAFDSAGEKIEKIEQQAVDESKPAQQGLDPDISVWNEKNPWIKDTTNVKSGAAQGFFNQFAKQNPNATVPQALAHVDAQLAKVFPADNTNPRRGQPNTTETNQRRPRQNNKELSMSDLTGDELNEWNKFGKTIFKTEKAYLKTVKDVRNS